MILNSSLKHSDVLIVEYVKWNFAVIFVVKKILNFETLSTRPP